MHIGHRKIYLHLSCMKEAIELERDNMISESQARRIEEYEQHKPLSVHWELRTILYLGILLLMAGIGILVYLNIDTIGHQVIITAIALLCIGCFFYSYQNQLPYSNEAVKHPSPFFDYVVLLGCLLFGVLIAYLQYQYSLFGIHYGLATLLPAVVFCVCAYLFDHKGVLSLGVTGLAAWAGLTATPLDILQENDFSDTTIMYTSVLFGMVVAAFSFFADRQNKKKHFSFVYNSIACNLIFIGGLSALFSEHLQLLSFVVVGLACYYYIRYAILHKSFLFLLLSVIYGYAGFTYVFFMLILNQLNDGGVAAMMLVPLYFIASCVGIILLIIFYKRILGIKK